jgi:hypothetical protein
MAGGPEDHFTDSRELYVLVEGDEWAHVEALDPDAGYWARRFAQLVNWRARGEKAVIEPSSLQRRTSQLKEIARLRAEGALTESEFEAVKARLLSDEASAYRKKLVRRPQWTRSTSPERHIGRRLHSSQGEHLLAAADIPAWRGEQAAGPRQNRALSSRGAHPLSSACAGRRRVGAGSRLRRPCEAGTAGRAVEKSRR